MGVLLKNSKKIIIGYDLANICSQISYGSLKDDGDVETVGIVEGEENYDIPTVLLKRIGTNQWLFGHHALRFYKEHPEEGILVTDLLDLALAGEQIQIDGKAYHPAALLSLFIKRSLSAAAKAADEERIEAIQFTCKAADERIRALIQRVEKTLDFKSTEISCQCYEESFFSYMIQQPGDLWNDGVLLLDYRGKKLEAICMERNAATVPKVMYCQSRNYSFAGTDRELTDIAKELCEGKTVSAVYLIGEKFSGDWMEESLKYLCTGRRVFQGNNLYSKGACYTLRREAEKKQRKDWEEDYIFLGPDKMKANIGMKVKKRGEDAYNALMDAGMCWEGLEEAFEFYIKGENNIELLITPLIKCPAKHVFMELDQLKLQPEEVTRIRMKLGMPEENRLVITVNDLGFGEFRQAVDGKWVKEIEMY